MNSFKGCRFRVRPAHSVLGSFTKRTQITAVRPPGRRKSKFCYIKAKSEGQSNSRKSSRRWSPSLPGSEGLPLSLYTPYRDLPPDGKTLMEGEESCDPAERKCKTPAHVYEAQCAMCNGTGVTMSKGRGHGKKRPSTCMLCHGLGYVRRTTSRFTPEVNCVGPNLTINRPGLQNGLPRDVSGLGSLDLDE